LKSKDGDGSERESVNIDKHSKADKKDSKIIEIGELKEGSEKPL